MISLGVSGGVDSSVCAVLLKEQGALVRGVFMNNWEGGEGCRAEQDRLDALRVCAGLGIPFSTRNFAPEYKEHVFAQFLDGYKRGFTPNPDILCNREVKFKVFLEDCLNSGATHVATGHYARVRHDGARTQLLRGVDKSKDQSYFLHAVPEGALRYAVFPLGDMCKTDVRKIAHANGLVNAGKKDSTGICFIGEQDFKTFLSKYLPAREGDIETENGVAVGRHAGALYYTTGQRAPMGGIKGFAQLPWFVLHKDVARNVLIVGQGKDHPALNLTTLEVTDVSFVAGSAPSTEFECEVQIRHLGEAIPARVRMADDGATVTLARPHFGAAKGQYAVMYQGDVCLGGGVIA